MTYKLVASINPRGVVEYQDLVERIEDGALIPFDPANSDYREYLAWIEEGNEAEEWTGN